MSTIDTSGPATERAARSRGPIPKSELAVAAVLGGLGVFALVDAHTIAVPASASAVGPRAFPYAVGALLVLSAVGLVIALLRGDRGEVEGGEDVDTDGGADWAAVLKLTGSFAALCVLVEPLGWLIAASVMFTGAAWTLGARPWWRALLVALVLNTVVQILFTQLLGVYLPAGPLEGVPGLG
ncbi:putative tricarboxylic transport membrane protein [Quadrisphaera granulorum]|uniref:Putative tricarboxylic transport membrane protein n=1 Tax=Quadrisphaera granulorum TaxID=317664 RepID=A0A316AC68_9ACTN|nr:tripartite tricarboxylate transporter TctB family protein [Quadrisphaera granulorum]PWJ55376.1 putative tricarboxylic transport membrane protein [Quadrisphaera granulorum]SZE95440.1 putative tricarboxylic transport membrane protein [Quadrisphaera granulorum]